MILSPEIQSRLNSEIGSFIVDQPMGSSNHFFLRFGYWNRVDVNKVQQIIGDSITVVEDSIDDDDCGYLFMYRLN